MTRKNRRQRRKPAEKHRHAATPSPRMAALHCDIPQQSAVGRVTL